MPYLCGFESQITGRLSPWCGVFTDDELKSYEYYNDLRYYYGIGPGTELPSTMMMPFVNSLVGLLTQGPNITGTFDNGTTFALPKLLMAFMNDGQIAEITNAVGVFDNQATLVPGVRDDRRLYMASRFVTMRGTVALERLNCLVEDGGPGGSGNHHSSSTLSTGGTTATLSKASKTFTKTACRPTPTHRPRSNSNNNSSSSSTRNETFVRIRLNDAVYPLPSCKDGPGSSCRLSDYAAYIAKKYAAQGSWAKNCNVTLAGAPTAVQGASFFTDLSKPWVKSLAV